MNPVYDNSQLQAYKDCPERYRLKYIEAVQKRTSGEEDHHRNFGRGIHAALEMYYKHVKAGTVLTTKEYHAAFTDIYPVSMKEDDLAKSPEGGVLLLDAYINHYDQQDRDLEILAVEVTDSFPIGKREDGTDILFTIKLDSVVKKQGCIYSMEHKTTGKSFSYGYWGQYDPNSQMTAQSAYCLWKYGECSGVIVNALRFGHRQRAYKGEPAGFYQEFQRNVINRNKVQIADWKRDQVEWIMKIERDRELTMPGMAFNKNEGQCGYCNFKEVCISVNDQQIIEQLYEKHDPQAYLTGEGGTDLTA